MILKSFGLGVGCFVFVEDGLDSAVCDELVDDLIDLCNEVLGAESKRECVGLGGHRFGEDLNACIALAHFCCGKVVNNPSVYLALSKRKLCVLICFELGKSIAFAAAEFSRGGTGLNRNGLACKVCLGSDSAVCLNYDSLSREAVFLGEEGVFLTLVGNRDTRHTAIVFAGLNAGKNRVEVDLLENGGNAELLANDFHNLNLDAYDLAALKVFEGRKVGAGSDNKLACFLNLCKSLALCAAAGEAYCYENNRK